MTDADDMVHITEGKFQQLICKDTRRVRKPEETMIRETCPQPHGSSMQYSFVAKTT